MRKKGSTEGPSASELIDTRIAELEDWRGRTLGRVRALIKQADSQAVEEVKWRKPSNPLGDFAVAADPLESDRVNVYEEWDSEEALSAFRGEGPGEDLSASIVRAHVAEHVVPSRDAR